MIKIIHTSDWHIGRSLYGRKRYNEFKDFLNWLSKFIDAQHIDALLIAGDIFDSNTPSNRSQELYYRFLCTTAKTHCRHIVIIGGNHDSPSFLNAPKKLLRTLNIYVMGRITDRLEDEVLILKDIDKKPQAIICTIPYLREKDIRTVEPGETIEEKKHKVVEGLKKHYASVCKIAEKKRKKLKTTLNNLPIIGMGHLFTNSSKQGDGIRDLYVGSLAHIEANAFPTCVNYFALGHLHIAQCLGESQHIRYSGSPIAMGYGEANQQKKIIQVEFNNNFQDIKEISVPCFQSLEKLSGSLKTIQNRIDELKLEDSTAWLEIEYTGKNIIGNLRELLKTLLDETQMEILCIKNRQIIERVINNLIKNESLNSLTPKEVFKRCLDSYQVPARERHEIIQTHDEILKLLYEEDINKQ